MSASALSALKWQMKVAGSNGSKPKWCGARSNERRKLNFQQVANNCFAFLLAGYETTSTALAFTAWLLAKHQQQQERLFDELADNLRNVKRKDFYNIVMELPYLDAVFHEVLRLYPPITFFVNRTCTKHCTIEGIEFQPGVQVGVPIWNIHRDDKIWPEPNAFRPER
ncbi:unnamed protein product [Toxocara canis]|uniref:Cytochrome p450 n=1 Tax=Toxocara canis TaxID=6265 RepID=A0A183U0K5_TOXCA|nr:unnamed protein product [Toxocara canis]